MIVYSKFNNNYRKKEYQLITSIVKNGEVFYSLKATQDKASNFFLNSFFDKYDYILANNFSIEVVRPEKVSDDKIKFKYQSGRTLGSLLFDEMQINNRDNFIFLIKEYVEFIKENVINSELSSEFGDIFGNTDNNRKVECLKIGFVDLGFDNIITIDGKYILIDYEWTFKFPVPYKYVIFRAITSFYASNSIYDPNKFFPLDKVYDLIGISGKDEKEFISFEYNFRKHVSEGFDSDLTEFADGYYGLKQEKNIDSGYFYQKNKEIELKNEEIELKNRQLNLKEREIVSIKSSKFWKLRNLYIEFKNKIIFLIFHPISFAKKYTKKIFNHIKK